MEKNIGGSTTGTQSSGCLKEGCIQTASTLRSMTGSETGDGPGVGRMFSYYPSELKAFLKARAAQ